MNILLLIILALGFVDLSANVNIAGISGQPFQFGVLLFLSGIAFVYYGMPKWLYNGNPAFTLVVLISLVNALRTVSAPSAIVDIVYLSAPMVFGAIAYKFSYEHDRCLVSLKLILVTPFIAATIIIVSFITGQVEYIEDLGPRTLIGMRSAALMVLPPVAISICVLGSRMSIDKKFMRLAAWSLLVSLAIIIGTLSRTSIAVLVVFAIIYSIMESGWRSKMLVLALATSIIVSPFVIEPLGNRILPGDDSVEEVATSGKFTSGRALIWLAVWSESIEQNLIGHGTGNAKPFVADRFPGSAGLPHNEYLRLYYDLGIFGVIFVSLAWLYRLRKHYLIARRMCRTDSYLDYILHNSSLMVTAGALLAGLFDNAFIYVFFMGNIFILYAMADHRQNQAAGLVQVIAAP